MVLMHKIIITHFLLVVTLDQWSKCNGAGARVKTVTVTYLDGDVAHLPCDIAGGEVYTVLWYKGNHGQPFYTFDGRPAGPAGSTAVRHWSDVPPAGFDKRAVFNTDTSPSRLEIRPVNIRDAGTFRCRVDYKANQTQNYFVVLNVIVKPEKPMLLSEPSNIETYQEGGNLQIMCIVKSGQPTPNVTWTLNDSEMYLNSLTSSMCPGSTDTPIMSVTMSITPPSLVVSRLQSSCIPRNLTQAKLSCIASNNNISVPVSSTIYLNVLVGPHNVTISRDQWPLSSGRDYKMSCTTSGSSPPATITWWKDGKFLEASNQIISEDKNVTMSEVRITASYEDNGKNLTCKAENAKMTNKKLSWKEVSLKLDVLYPPKVFLKFGSNIDRENIVEGTDVYFDCIIESNPSVYKVEWTLNNIRISQDLDAGILVSTRSLVLQSVKKSSTGNYTCTASNIEGDTISNTQILNVKYKPCCIHEAPVTIAISETSTKNLVVCDTRAEPRVKIYRWELNTTAGIMQIGNQRTPRLYLSKDQIRFLETKTELGIIRCWGTNSIGESQSPCIFKLVAAGLPGPPEDCHVTRETNESLTVLCSPGWSGGLKQTFHLELWDGEDQLLLRNVTEKKRARFELNSLQSGKRLIIKIYSANKKGRSSKIVELESSTSKVAQLQIETKPGYPSESTETFVGMFAGVFIIVVIFAVSAITLIIIRKLRDVGGNPAEVGHPEPGGGGEEYLQLDGRDQSENKLRQTGAGHVGTSLHNDSVIFNKNISDVDHSPSYTAGVAGGGAIDFDRDSEWHNRDYDSHLRTNVKLNPLFHQYSN